MTFEEFFIKKKIDLKALKAADEPLFEEFKAHYSAMGEKSFDHSKKFWFNKLRKSFHLAEEETVIAKPVEKQVTPDTASETSRIPTAKPAGFKPRFKAPSTTVVDEAQATSKQEIADSAESTSDSIPTGFKPRFKAGLTKAPDAAASTPASDETTDEASTSAPKPTGFKPRFKAGVTKAPDAAASTPASDETTDEASTSAPKPTGFKPRFKAGVTKAPDAAASTSASDETTDEASTSAPKPTGFKPRFKAGVTKAPDAAASTSASDETTDEATTSAPKPTGFKPRFKAGVTKTETAEQTQLPDTKDEIKLDASVKAEPENNSTETQEPAASKPTGFKPRFKAGVTKTETAEQTQLPDTKDEIKLDASVKAEPENNGTETQEPAASKPTGFKPRFKAGLTKIDKKEE
ncbi:MULTISPECIES: hypothetical protein [Sphingobacterium]|uniref:hypothetical protein n=3 Tax=Sphingobacteriaceae TaxID=84566 RepID=UPI000965ADA5|nr:MULTISPECIES: hypothetical protein [Sphingobacterium]OJZ10780.1 MAG: hypothetical protein BGP15_10145 [Sphingobacterium sp. 40-24]